MDFQKLKEDVTVDACPLWTCGDCRDGVLIMRKDSYRDLVTKASEEFLEFAGDPDDLEFLFSCIADCSKCSKSYQISGTSRWEFDGYYSDPHTERWKVLKVKSVYPHIAMFDVPNRCPEEVKSSIDNASLLYWVNRSAFLNALRTTVEIVCNQQKVNKTFLTRSRKKKRHTLHERLTLLEKIKPDAAETLMAIKWLGNSGSHDDAEPSVDDTIKAMELLEHAIQQLYSDREIKIKRLTKRINKKKGL